MKRDIRILVCLICIIVPVFFCGCNPESRRNSLTVTMSLGEEEWRVLRAEIFPQFEQDHNVSIRSLQIESGQLATKLEALAAGNKQEIDVFAQDNMELSALINKDLVLDLSAYAGSIPSEVLPNLVDSCTFGAKLMFMPFRPNVQIVFYNKDAFAGHDLTVPRTWGELLSVAEKFKEDGGQGRVLLKAFGGNPTATQVYEFVLQAGGDPYSFDDAGCVQAFEFLQKLWPYVSQESIRAKWDTANEILARQEAYLGQNWPFGIVVLIDRYKLDFIGTYSGWSGPAGEVHVIGGDVFGISENSSNIGLALDFIKYMQSKSVQEKLAARLGWPSIRADAYAAVPEKQRSHYAAVAQALSRGVFRRNVTWWPAYAKYISEAFQEIVIGQQPVQENLTKFKERLEKEKSLFR
ncbi:MAG: extracellular solute-binding protein [Candidatus Omnitrophota bacterium]